MKRCIQNTSNLFLLFSILLFFVSGDTFAQVAQKNEVISLRDGLKEMLQSQGAKNLKKLTLNVDADKASEIKEKHKIESAGSFTVYQGMDGDNLIGTVVIVNEDGKEGPLQVLVAFTREGSIYDMGFTVFGEDKGKTAMNWSFVKQFIDKKTSDKLVLGDDIDGISGATWTSESVANAVKRASVLYAEFLM